MTSHELLLDLYRHMQWADASMWAAVLASEEACSDAGTLERLHHIHQVQHVFYWLWRGQPIDPHAGKTLDPPDMARWAREYYPEAEAYLASLTAEELASPLALPWRAELTERMGFEPAETQLGDTVMQVYFHTTHHRAQVATRLRELGATPPLIDYIAWVWHGRPEAVWE